MWKGYSGGLSPVSRKRYLSALVAIGPLFACQDRPTAVPEPAAEPVKRQRAGVGLLTQGLRGTAVRGAHEPQRGQRTADQQDEGPDAYVHRQPEHGAADATPAASSLGVRSSVGGPLGG